MRDREDALSLNACGGAGVDDTTRLRPTILAPLDRLCEVQEQPNVTSESPIANGSHILYSSVGGNNDTGNVYGGGDSSESPLNPSSRSSSARDCPMADDR